MERDESNPAERIRAGSAEDGADELRTACSDPMIQEMARNFELMMNKTCTAEKYSDTTGSPGQSTTDDASPLGSRHGSDHSKVFPQQNGIIAINTLASTFEAFRDGTASKNTEPSQIHYDENFEEELKKGFEMGKAYFSELRNSPMFSFQSPPQTLPEGLSSADIVRMAAGVLQCLYQQHEQNRFHPRSMFPLDKLFTERQNELAEDKVDSAEDKIASGMASDNHVSNGSPVANDSLVASDSPVANSSPVANDSLVASDSPVANSSPVTNDSLVASDSPVANSSPVTNDSLVASDSPVSSLVASDSSVVNGSPVTNDSLVASDSPVSSLVASDSPVVNGSPVANDSLVANGSPVANDSPIASNSLVASDNPVANGSPVANDSLVASDNPVANGSPVANDSLVASDSPVANGSPVANDSPIASNSLVASDNPVASDSDKASDTNCEVHTSGQRSEVGNNAACSEPSLHKDMKNCAKNPGHAGFIPVTDFSIVHLPESYRDEDVFDCVKTTSDLTVRIGLTYASEMRPDKWRDGGQKYPFADQRGTKIKINLTGTGVVKSVNRNLDHLRSGLPEASTEKLAGEVRVQTARHVVFDDYEARAATCRLFFDHPKCSEKLLLQVFKVESADTASDTCELVCGTGDPQVVDRLETLLEKSAELWRKVQEKFRDSRIQDKLIYIASHPHGCSKQVTIGQVKDVSVMGLFHSQYTYNAPTCPGTSGARVNIIGDAAEVPSIYTDHVHSGSLGGGVNHSGQGREFEHLVHLSRFLPQPK